jgi:4'-phosphopantetheinyl transferase EntD
VIAGILPPQVVSAQSYTDLPERLFPEEEAVIAAVAAVRAAEFRSVRGCARLALARLGLPRPPMVPGERGAPRWPEGIVGSMTHCPGYRAAAVARAGEVAGVGIDAEPDAPLPGGVFELVTRPEEREHLADLARAHPRLPWGRLVFSAKESVYKTWFPLARCWLSFEDVRVSFDADRRRFRAEVLSAELDPGRRPFTALSGRWTVGRGLVLTTATLPAPGASQD